MEIGFSQQIVEKYSNIKFHENPCSGSPVVPCGLTDGQACVMRLRITFGSLAKAPEKSKVAL